MMKNTKNIMKNIMDTMEDIMDVIVLIIESIIEYRAVIPFILMLVFFIVSKPIPILPTVDTNMIDNAFNTFNEEVEGEKINIYSVETKNIMEGKYSSVFILSSGKIAENSYYYVYMDSEEKGKILVKLDTQNTYIKDVLESGEQPYLVQTFYKGYTNGEEISSELSYNTLYIPKGYIEQDYNFKVE